MADRPGLLTTARIVAAKDLGIERRSRVVLTQVLPFAVMTLLLFGFSISPDAQIETICADCERSVLARVAPGLLFLTVLFASLLAVGRAASIDSGDGTGDQLLLSGAEPGGVFLGKAVAIAVQLVAVAGVVAAGALVLFAVDVAWSAARVVLVVTATAAAVCGIATAGTLYAALATGVRGRETLLPLLVVPVLAPVLLGAGQAVDAALFGSPADGWPWVAALAAFALLYTGVGLLFYGSLVEDA